MTAADRAQIDQLRRRCEAAEESARKVAAENTILAQHLGDTQRKLLQLTARFELLDLAYGRLLGDTRRLHGGHLNVDALRRAALDAELVPLRRTGTAG